MAEITVTEDSFGSILQPITGISEPVRRFTFRNGNSLTVQVITYGATVTSIQCPDKNGKVDDIVLGFDNIEGYKSKTNPYFGATVGRVCNRIRGGRFTLNGNVYELSKNVDNTNHLHGGDIGYDKVNWTAYQNGTKVIMTHVDPDNFQGYPGAVIAIVDFELKPDNVFSVEFKASVSKPTPLNLTNHSYFNLAGHAKEHNELYNHVVNINADKITIMDAESIVTGEFQNVGGTAYDLRVPSNLGEKMAKLPAIGFDNNYCVTCGTDKSVKFIAEVRHPKSGRVLEVYSDQPGVQFYTSNWMPDPTNNIYPHGKRPEEEAPSKETEPIYGKNGARYLKHAAFCLETQNYPDAINHSNFPKAVVNPWETYTHTVLYKLSVQNYD